MAPANAQPRNPTPGAPAPGAPPVAAPITPEQQRASRNRGDNPRTGTAIRRDSIGGDPQLPNPADIGTAANQAANRARRRGVGANSLTGLTSSVTNAKPLLLKKTLLAGGK
jgi:hypothetical protein